MSGCVVGTGASRVAGYVGSAVSGVMEASFQKGGDQANTGTFRVSGYVDSAVSGDAGASFQKDFGNLANTGTFGVSGYIGSPTIVCAAPVSSHGQNKILPSYAPPLDDFQWMPVTT